jgi:hypothetical protein
VKMVFALFAVPLEFFNSIFFLKAILKSVKRRIGD